MAENENERLVLFSDAVFAITITLLVLEIALPVSAEGLSDGALWAEITALWPKFEGYLISYLVIAILWVGHRRKFELITRSSAGLIWLNLLLLLGISWMPFATALLAENGGRLATVLYAALVAAVSAVSAAMTIHGVRAGLVDPDAARPGAWRLAWPPLCTVAVFVLSVPVALRDPDLGQYFWLLLIPAHAMTERILQRDGRPES